MILTNFIFKVFAVKCNFGDKNFGKCLSDAINENFPKLHNPNKNAPIDTVDPYFFELGDVIFNGTSLARGIFTILNTTVEGAKNLNVQSASVEKNEDKMNILGDLKVSLASADGFFNSNLSISELLFITKGKFKGIFENTSGKFNISGILENNENFRVNDFDINLVVGKMTFKLSGITKDETISKKENLKFPHLTIFFF